jgi:hypothetical protein
MNWEELTMVSRHEFQPMYPRRLCNYLCCDLEKGE